MAWELCFHRRNVDYSTLFDGPTDPGVIKLFFFIFLVLIVFVPFDSATQEAIENFVDFHLLPFRGHKVALAWGMCVQGHGVDVLQFV